jgi:hypothetical protein
VTPGISGFGIGALYSVGRLLAADYVPTPRTGAGTVPRQAVGSNVFSRMKHPEMGAQSTLAGRGARRGL